VHDLVRSFSQFVAKHEGLLLENEQEDVSSTLANTKLRHISVSREVTEFKTLKSPESLRTLMIFRSAEFILKYYLTNLCCLRVLHITDVNLAELPESVCHLKHLRYLGLKGTSISTVPEGIGDLNFLQLIDLQGCENLSQLPNSILKLQKLRFINIEGTKITLIPRCFGELKDLVKVLGFPTHLDCSSTDGWCSLDELGSLSKLQAICVGGLEKVPSGFVAARAKLSSKLHLTKLDLNFTSRLEDTGEVNYHTVSKEEQERVEEVLANLCPPTCIEILNIDGYFGQQLPRWMRKMAGFDNLKRLVLKDLAFCKQLPSGLCQLPVLDYLWVKRAPSIEHIGYNLLLPPLGCDSTVMDESTSGTEIAETRQFPHPCSAGLAFPKLRYLRFQGMLRWEEWEWEQKVTAMPTLEDFQIQDCKLRYLPAGLAYHASALRLLDLRNMSELVCIENFPSLTNLWLDENPKLERIANSQTLRQICIARCPRINLLQNLPSLQGIQWNDLDAESLPDYLRETKIHRLHLNCSFSLLKLISLQDASSEWGKIEHVHHLNAIGWISKEDQVDRHIYYTKEPYSFNADMGE
jgi:Leucine-rich repeat (LRR) protein